MANDAKKSEGPTCACGWVDLYEESLKLKASDKEEVIDSTTVNKTNDDNSSAGVAGKDVQKQEQTQK
jgi:hypothetical protein